MTPEEKRAEQLKAAKIKAEIEAEKSVKTESADKEASAEAQPEHHYASLEEALNSIGLVRIYLDGGARAGEVFRFLLTGIARSGVAEGVENGVRKEYKGLNAPLAEKLLAALDGPAPAGFRVTMDGSSIGADPTVSIWDNKEAMYSTIGNHDVMIPLPKSGRRPSITIPQEAVEVQRGGQAE